MATIMHTIYSDTIKGAGLIASGPYGDKHWAGADYGSEAADFGNQLAIKAIHKAEKMESDNLIDSTSNFNNAPVYIFSGSNDKTYPPAY